MSTEQIDSLKKQFDFDSWRGVNKLDRDLTAKQLCLPGDLLPGLEPARMREIDPGDGSRLLRASWSAPDDESTLYVMDVRECRSREHAHEVLLELLANTQTIDIKQVADKYPGDIAFAATPSAIIFARGNVVFSIYNGGDKARPVTEIASAVDHWITETF